MRPLSRAPLADGANQIRFCGLLGHGGKILRTRRPQGGARVQADCLRQRYLRIPRSADVSASENAGRANSRSAYFISGAACFGIWMP